VNAVRIHPPWLDASGSPVPKLGNPQKCEQEMSKDGKCPAGRGGVSSGDNVQKGRGRRDPSPSVTAHQVFAVNTDDLPLLALSGLSNPVNAQMTRLILNWGKQAAQRKPGNGSLCIGCDTEFHPSTGIAQSMFCVALPFAANEGTALISAVCGKCTAKAGSDGAVIDMAMESYRAFWPDIQVVEGEHG
jgi:hypothetical protein